MKNPEESARQDEAGRIFDTDVRCLDDEEVLAFLDRRLEGARLRAVERHLDDCDSCRRLIGYVAREETNLSATVESVERGLRPGDTVDHFRVEDRIGVGGMGEIYLATDTNLLRPVALKLIGEKLITSTEARDRLLVEARATARVRHPGIVEIHSVGVHDGRPYLALEHVEGETLKAYLDRAKPKLFEILDMGIQIADALAAAHAEGVLHRDLKPHNAIIGLDGRIRVLDFGLAKVKPPVDVDEDDLSSWYDVTRADVGSVRGTPGYMAPEQWRNEEVTGTADVWGLGVVLYEMISGDRPYRESSAISYAVKVCDIDPVPPLSESAGVPESLRQLVQQCLDKDPNARPSAVDVTNTLRTIASDDAVELARSLDRAADEWSNLGETSQALWRGATLERAERVLRSDPFMMDARSTGFLTASVHEDHQRQVSARTRLRAAGGLAIGFAVLASIFAWESVAEKDHARAERDVADKMRAETLIESAETDWATGRALQARAKLRTALEIVDSTRARVLLWSVEQSPLVWSHEGGAGVYDLTVTSDDRTIVAAMHDGTVRLIDADTLETSTLRGLDDQTLEVDVSANGEVVVGAARNGRVVVWNRSAGTRRDLGTQHGRLDAVALTADGRRLVAANRTGEIFVFDLIGSQDTIRFTAKSGVYDLAVDNGTLFTAETDGHVRVYDLATHAERRAHATGRLAAVLTLSIRAGAVAAGDADGHVFVWTADGSRHEFPVSSRAIQRVVLTDGFVLAAGTDRRVRRVTIADRTVHDIATHEGGVWGLANVGTYGVVSGSIDGVFRRARWDRVRPPPTDGGHHTGATSVAFSPDGRRVVSGGYDRTLREWDTASGRLIRVHRGHQGTIYDVAVGVLAIYTASHDRTARIWRDGVDELLIGHSAGLYGITVDERAGTAFTVGADGLAITWNLKTRVPSQRRVQSAMPLYAVAHDRGQLAFGSGDGTVHVHRGSTSFDLDGHDGAVWAARFAPDRSLVTAGYDGTVRRWNGRTGTVIGRTTGRLYGVDTVGEEVVAVGAGAWLFGEGDKKPFVGHRAEVNDVTVSPDGKLVATASDDGTVRVWDVSTQRSAWRPDLIDQHEHGDTRCSLDKHGKITDRGGDVRATWTGAEQIIASATGCIVRNGSTLRWYGGRGEHRELSTDVRAIAPASGRVIALRGDRAIVLDERGQQIETKPVEEHAVVVMRTSDGDVLGYDDGRIEFDGRTLDATPTSAVTVLSPGPRRTIIAGFENGLFGLWSREDGTRLSQARLHGAVRRVTVTEATFEAHSELGDTVEGPGHLDEDWCRAIERAAEESPVRWESGRAVRSAGGSSCNPS